MKPIKNQIFATFLAAMFLLTVIPTVLVANTEGSTVITLTIGSTEYTVNGVKHQADAAPFVDTTANRTMVPLRLVAEALGAEVGWNPDTRTATISRSRTVTSGNSTSSEFVQLSIVVGTSLPNGMGTSVVIDGRTFVPIAYVAEFLGASTSWDGATRTVTIIDNATLADTVPTAEATIITSTPTPSTPATSTTDFERAVFDAMNAERLRQGLGRLEWNSVLANAARWESRERADGPRYENHPTYGRVSLSPDPLGATIRLEAGELTPEAVIGHSSFQSIKQNFLDEVVTMGVGYDEASRNITLAFTTPYQYLEGFVPTGSYQYIAGRVYMGNYPYWVDESPYVNEVVGQLSTEVIEAQNKYNAEAKLITRDMILAHPDPLYIPRLLAEGKTYTQIQDLLEKEVIRLTNSIRAEYGLPALQAHAGLGSVARQRSQEMVDHRTFGHRSPTTGLEHTEHAQAMGLSTSYAGENCVWYGDVPRTPVDAWMNSTKGHREFILSGHSSSSFEANPYIGVGVAFEYDETHSRITRISWTLWQMRP